MTPSLDRQPVIRLVGDGERVRRSVAAHAHIYLSDLSEVSLVGLDLSGKTFYGCCFGPSSVHESSLAECELVGCRFDPVSPPPPTSQAVPPEDAGLIEQSLVLLSPDADVASAAAEFLVRRLAPYEGSAGSPPAHASVFLAFLYLSANHPSELVRQEIASLSSRVSIDSQVVRYLVGRAQSAEAEDKAWVLACLTYSDLDVLGVLEPPDVTRLLRDESSLVVSATLDLLVRYCSAPDTLRPLLGEEAESLSRELLGATDPDLSQRALRLFKNHFELVAFDAASTLLRDPDPETRAIAFEGLFFNTVWSLEPNFLLDYEPTDAERRRMLAWEKETRDAYGDGHLVTPDELTDMLQSHDATVRAQGLRVLGFTGDERFAEWARQATGDQDPQVRLHAVRALRWMRGAAPGGDSRGLLGDESADVRREAELWFRDNGE